MYFKSEPFSHAFLSCLHSGYRFRVECYISLALVRFSQTLDAHVSQVQRTFLRQASDLSTIRSKKPSGEPDSFRYTHGGLTYVQSEITIAAKYGITHVTSGTAKRALTYGSARPRLCSKVCAKVAKRIWSSSGSFHCAFIVYFAAQILSSILIVLD